MEGRADLLERVKASVTATEPDATVVLFGSFTRGNERPDSDLDVLILVDRDPVTGSDEKRIKYPLYEIEFDTGQIISPIVLSRNEWHTKHRITPFYENVLREGVVI